MPGSIKEIARIANVSRGTVDRALNDRPGVNKEVAKRVKEIANAMGYRPNVVAKALATHRKPTVIGVIINSEGNPFFDDVLAGIDAAKQEIFDFGVNVVVKKMKGYDPKQQLSLIRSLVEDGLDALAITPVSNPSIRDELNGLIAAGIRIVCFNLDLADVNYLAYIGCDYYKSGETLGGMIGFVTGGKALLGVIACTNNLEGHRKRIEGCRSVLASEYPESRIVDIIEAEDNDEIAYEKTLKMLLEHPEMNALCFNAGGTSGGLRAVRELGLEKKFKIFTFDMTPVVIESIRNGIVQSTICQQPFEQGYQSIKILFDALMNNQVPKTNHIYTELNVKIRYNI
ncbi:LacI family DNA-binding transcriptional regulator [Flexilinea flocculi]|jgi:LacI family transcriptional regulator|uniref:Transcriptional regulator, LacI family n=1 Tax=Flexilinea flocculi TaxID=1678840 RepID=A0A0K8PB53_9CHLR|nr:LacI family DNA-binding transcriptional regulator [Flexilinea flocculi]NMB94288.1 substrate-binding domain-containing protein [Flexilinea flocculi]GAP39739.1 transcriptional regulator, LacI family [Flexilinea flocculi]